MAFFGNDEEENNKVPLSNGFKTAQAGLSQAQGSGMDSGGAAQEANKGSGWTNLKSYLDANSGDSERMGDQVVTATQPTFDAGNKAVDKWTTGQKKEVDDGLKTGPDIDFNNIDKVSQKDFDSWSKPTYTGPAEATADADVLDATSKAFQTGENATSHYGRFGLLDDTYGRNDYTAGQKGFDSFLLGRSDGVNTIKNNADTLSNRYDSSFQSINERIKQREIDAADLSSVRGNTLQEKLSTLNNDLEATKRIPTTPDNVTQKKQVGDAYVKKLRALTLLMGGDPSTIPDYDPGQTSAATDEFNTRESGFSDILRNTPNRTSVNGNPAATDEDAAGIKSATDALYEELMGY